jgi:hypothetical protein
MRQSNCLMPPLEVTINYSPWWPRPHSIHFWIYSDHTYTLWNTTFFLEFSLDKGIQKNKNYEDQVNFKHAMRKVLFRYFKFVLFPNKALARTPAFFTTYLDNDSEDCMFTEAILKAWDPVHLPTCRWYLDCPLKRPHPLKSPSMSHWSQFWKVRLLLHLKLKQKILLRRVERGRNQFKRPRNELQKQRHQLQ